jgi:hypothetical protein
MADKLVTKKEVIGLAQAQADSLKELSERVSQVEKDVENQESKNDSVIKYVLIAFVFTVLIVAVEVLLSNNHTDSVATGFSDKIIQMQSSVDTETNNMDNQMQLLKARNPYLK